MIPLVIVIIVFGMAVLHVPCSMGAFATAMCGMARGICVMFYKMLVAVLDVSFVTPF